MSDLLLQIVIDKLASPLLEKLNDLCSLKENTGKLRQSLPLVLAFLEDAEKRQETEKAIEVWLLELKNVTYESEDLLDELTAEIMLCENHSRISDKVRNLLPFEPSRHLFDLAKELRNKLKELQDGLDPSNLARTRHSSVVGNFDSFPLDLIKVKHLRTLLCYLGGCEGLTRMPAGIGKLVHLQTLPIYIVGKGRGESIAELNSLNLRGELSIKCLENVTDAKEAQKANLREKKHLNMLRLIWGDNNDQGHNLKAAKGSTLQGLKYGKNNGSPGSSRSNSFWDSGIEVKDILECLEPHPNLRKLFIKGYSGIKFPGWVLPNLVQVVLINFRRCENLPTLGQLPFLKTICLQGMDGVVCIAEEFYGSDSQTLFPSLKELKLRDFPNLEQWSSIDDREAFPCLGKLIVDGCPNLRKMPVFPSLQRLELRNCHPKIMNSIKDVTSLSILVIDSFQNLLHLPGELLENNTCLRSFEVRKCQNLRSLPSELGSLTALKSLIISHCENLAHLSPSLQNLKALEFLEINDCHGMKTLREDVIGGLSSLRTLVIENCNNLISLSNGLRFLTALERLSIMSCPKLAFLPNGLQNLSTLQSLSILSCPELFSLPVELQHVTTLQSLVIHSCPGLTILPDWVGNFSSLRSLSISNCHYLTSLPAGLQHLSKLQHLSIQDCPLLERLCKQKKGLKFRLLEHLHKSLILVLAPGFGLVLHVPIVAEFSPRGIFHERFCPR
ncbi:hypothetical protein TEA_029379 [Camellia sinensis var. sinensis]|uniref:Uncharacterized protein n=1 Tax=Camellia sinensis var. sinensis TaxID=542762 RepID=A0A4S4DX97_CAMSN|nr:hypothetical protein TEA_029379 [Camellia sinensis var. sinensis]